jgi:hypothetical protein
MTPSESSLTKEPTSPDPDMPCGDAEDDRDQQRPARTKSDTVGSTADHLQGMGISFIKREDLEWAQSALGQKRFSICILIQ